MKRIFVTLAAILVMAVTAFGQITPSLSVSGRLTNATTGTAISGTPSINFSIYNAETGGTLLFSVVQSVPVSNGLFNALISPIALPFDQDYWLQLQIGAEILAPRQKITPAPYAIYANQAGSLAGGVLTIAGGNAGIGTTAPATKLHVNGSGTIVTFQGPTGTTSFNPSTGIISSSGAIALRSGSSNDIVSLQGSDGISRLSVNGTSGNVGIGTTVPSQKLDVVGNVLISGSVGIGTTAPAVKLHVNGSAIIGATDVYGPFSGIIIGDTDTCNGDAVSQFTCTSEPRTCIDLATINASTQKRNVTCQGSVRIAETPGTVSANSLRVPGMWVPIAQVTLTSSGNITLTDIPSDTKMLKVAFYVSGTDTIDRRLYVRFNSDAENNYNRLTDGTGCTVSENNVNSAIIGIVARSTTTPSTWTTGEFIVNNANNTRKQFTGVSSMHAPGITSARCTVHSLWFNNTVAIRNVTIFPDVGALLPGSHATLMGIF